MFQQYALQNRLLTASWACSMFQVIRSWLAHVLRKCSRRPKHLIMTSHQSVSQEYLSEGGPGPAMK